LQALEHTQSYHKVKYYFLRKALRSLRHSLRQFISHSTYILPLTHH